MNPHSNPNRSAPAMRPGDYLRVALQERLRARLRRLAASMRALLAKVFSRRTLLAAGLVGLLSLALPWDAAYAGKSDQEKARAALQAGEILPLQEILKRVQKEYAGKVLELELDREDGRWIYEIKLLQPDGQLLKLDVDAKNAQVIKVKKKGSAKRS